MLRRAALLAVGAGLGFAAADPAGTRAAGAAVPRTARAVTTFGLVAADFRSARRNAPGSPELAAALAAAHERTAARLRALCDANGGIYAKAAQVLSTAAGLPGAYRDQLAALQDAAPPRPFAEVDAALRAELGASAAQLFAEFDPVAAAAASLAQVHRARLADGREVAVKVQYPGLATAVAADLMTLRLLARLAHNAPAGTRRGDQDSPPDASASDDESDGGVPDLSWVVAQLERNLSRELDFVAEGRNAERVAAAFAAFAASGGGGGSAVATAPAVVWERSGRRVLTMAWQDGCRVDDADALRAAGLDTRDVARALVDAVGQMAFCFGFVHGDLHPGNIRVVAAPAAPRGALARLLRLPAGRPRPQLVLLDHGLYAELDEAQRLAYCALWRAVALGDAAAATSAGGALVAGTGAQWALMTLRPEALSRDARARARVAAKLRSAADVADFLSGVPPALGVAFRAQGLLRAVTLQLGLSRGERMRRTLHAANAGARCRGGEMPRGAAARARLAAARLADGCLFAARVATFSTQMLAARLRGGAPFG